MLQNLLLYEARYGAYTELVAGLSKDIQMENTGGFRKSSFLPMLIVTNDALVQPWGRNARTRSDLEDPELQRKYWEYCEEQVKDYYS